jgi:hypothetical protein
VDFKLESKTHRPSSGTFQWRPAPCLASCSRIQNPRNHVQTWCCLVSLFLGRNNINFSKTKSSSWLAGTAGWVAQWTCARASELEVESSNPSVGMSLSI